MVEKETESSLLNFFVQDTHSLGFFSENGEDLCHDD